MAKAGVRVKFGGFGRGSEFGDGVGISIGVGSVGSVTWELGIFLGRELRVFGVVKLGKN